MEQGKIGPSVRKGRGKGSPLALLRSPEWLIRPMVSFTLSVLLFEGYRSDNFVVGVTNDNPQENAPVLWDYTLCGQYPGAVPNGATVSVQCTNVYERRMRFRYVIVQFPLINDQMNFCEIEVFTIGTTIRFITIL